MGRPLRRVRRAVLCVCFVSHSRAVGFATIFGCFRRSRFLVLLPRGPSLRAVVGSGTRRCVVRRQSPQAPSSCRRTSHVWSINLVTGRSRVSWQSCFGTEGACSLSLLFLLLQPSSTDTPVLRDTERKPNPHSLPAMYFSHLVV